MKFGKEESHLSFPGKVIPQGGGLSLDHIPLENSPKSQEGGTSKKISTKKGM